MYMTGHGKREMLYECPEGDEECIALSMLALRLINIYGLRWPRC